jgi:hypothetical protein
MMDLQSLLGTIKRTHEHEYRYCRRKNVLFLCVYNLNKTAFVSKSVRHP